MSFKRKMPWTSQPQYPVEIDRSKGLSFAANFISIAPRNEVNGHSPSSSGVRLATTPVGRGVESPTISVGAIVYPNSGVIPAGSAAFTIIAAGAWGAEARRAQPVFYGDESAAPYRQHTLLVNADSGGVALSGVISAVTYDDVYLTEVQSIAGVVDGKPHVFGWRNGTNAALSIWRDGVNVTASKTGGTATLPSTFPLYVHQSNVPANNRGVLTPTSGVFIFQRTLSDAEMAFYTTGPWQLFRPRDRRIYVEAGGAASQTLTPSLFTDADTFYTHAVTAGAVTLTPALFTDADTFYSAVLSADGALQTLTASLFTDADTFYSAALQAGIGLSPTLFTDPDTFYSATLQSSTPLSPALFTDADTFYAHTATVGAVALSPVLYTDADTFYAAILSQASPQTLTASLFTDLDTFYGATIPSDALSGGGGAGYFAATSRRKPYKRPRSVKEILDAAMATLDEAPAPVQKAARKAVAPFIARTPVFTFEGAVDVDALALDAKRVDNLLKLLVEYERVQEEEEEEMLLMWTAH